MRSLAFAVSFVKQYEKLTASDQKKVKTTLKDFLEALQANKISQGFGYKKIAAQCYEIRVNLDLRVVMLSEGNLLICHAVGNHEDVENFLKKF